ncbi:hypothetical protein [Streptomyces sp. NPDC056361]|uniref:hypothetical protein n=1 Tax=Streptomyces sp. NPDC056361 TaxID=3345795 RepID=UPI0035D624D5
MARRPDPRKPVKSRTNPLDAVGITYIDYKDTDLLRKLKGGVRAGDSFNQMTEGWIVRGLRDPPARRAE